MGITNLQWGDYETTLIQQDASLCSTNQLWREVCCFPFIWIPVTEQQLNFWVLLQTRSWFHPINHRTCDVCLLTGTSGKLQFHAVTTILRLWPDVRCSFKPVSTLSSYFTGSEGWACISAAITAHVCLSFVCYVWFSERTERGCNANSRSVSLEGPDVPPAKSAENKINFHPY